jgi:hypothetical protein
MYYLPVDFSTPGFRGAAVFIICDPTQQNDLLCAFENSGKVKKNYFFSIHDVFFVKIDQLLYPDI